MAITISLFKQTIYVFMNQGNKIFICYNFRWSQEEQQDWMKKLEKWQFYKNWRSTCDWLRFMCNNYTLH